MITTRLMTLEDLEALLPELAADQAEGTAAMVRQRLQARGLNLVAQRHGKILACGGFLQAWEGVGDAWLYLVPGRRWDQLCIYRHLRRELPHLMRLGGLWRLECVVRADWPEAVRLVCRLGFQYEGTRRRYGPDGRDFHAYALVKEG